MIITHGHALTDQWYHIDCFKKRLDELCFQGTAETFVYFLPYSSIDCRFIHLDLRAWTMWIKKINQNWRKNLVQLRLVESEKMKKRQVQSMRAVMYPKPNNRRSTKRINLHLNKMKLYKKGFPIRLFSFKYSYRISSLGTKWIIMEIENQMYEWIYFSISWSTWFSIMFS